MRKPQKRWYLDSDTHTNFDEFRVELSKELDLSHFLTQNDFVAKLCEFKSQIMDVIVNYEKAAEAGEETEGKVPA